MAAEALYVIGAALFAIGLIWGLSLGQPKSTAGKPPRGGAQSNRRDPDNPDQRGGFNAS